MNMPRASAYWGFWATLAWGVLISVVFIVLQIIVTIAVAVVGEPGIAEADLLQKIATAAESGDVFAWSTIVTTIVCGSLILGVIMLKRGSELRDYLCVTPVASGALLKWLGLLAGFAVASDLITVFVLSRPVVPEVMSAAYATANPVWVLWIALIVGAPLFEEMFFRGFLFKGFEASFMGPAGAVVVTSALWTSIHVQYDAYLLATIFLLGLLIGAARVVSRSIFVPVAMHSASNLVSTVQTALLT